MEKDGYTRGERKYSSDHLETDSYSAYSSSLSPQSASSCTENEPGLFLDVMDTCDYTTISVPKISPSLIHSYSSVAPPDTLSTNIDIGMIYVHFYVIQRNIIFKRDRQYSYGKLQVKSFDH